MENYSKVAMLLLIMLFACQDDPESLPDVNSSQSIQEQLLSTRWVYERVVARGTDYFFANGRMELGNNRNALGGNRADLVRRQIQYDENGTYQLKWAERGDYALGTEGEANWQPDFGSWELRGDTLVHNSNFFYETKYVISLDDISFSRTSFRLMVEANQGAQWTRGEVVQQTEVFKRME